MRPCTPILVRTRAAGIRIQVRTASRRARRGAIANPQAPSHVNSRTARRHEGAGARQKAFFSFGPCTARFLFGKIEKKMGVHCPAISMAESPGRLITAPTVFAGIEIFFKSV